MTIPGNECNGRIGFHDGQIAVELPAAGGTPAVLCPSTDCDIRVNGQVVEKPTPIFGFEDVHVRPWQRLPFAEMGRVWVDSAAQVALLVVQPLGCLQVAEQPLIHEWQPHVIRGPGTDLTVQQVLAELARLSVRVGIDQEAIARALAEHNGREVVIARGRPPQPGTPGRVEWLPELQGAATTTAGPSSSLIYRVEPGQAFAQVISPMPGEPGQSLYGALLPAEPPPPFSVQLGPGLRQSDDELQILALEPGRPVLARTQERWSIGLIPCEMREGDIAGQLQTDHDLIIHGNLLDGADLRVGGTLFVHGKCVRAQIRAGGSVTVRGHVLWSCISAGELDPEVPELAALWRQVSEDLGRLLTICDQLQRMPAFRTADLHQKGWGMILPMLVQRQIKDLPVHIARLTKRLKTLTPWQQSLAQLATMQAWSAVNDLAELVTLREESLRVVTLTEARASLPGDICADSAEHSELTSSRDIMLMGRGAFMCKLRASDRIIARTAIIGGEATAINLIAASELGNASGAITTISVRAGKVRSTQTHPGCQIVAYKG